MRQHELDVTSLISGLLFVALGFLFLLDQTDAIEVQLRWLVPVALIVLGLAFLVPRRTVTEERNGWDGT